MSPLRPGVTALGPGGLEGQEFRGQDQSGLNNDSAGPFVPLNLSLLLCKMGCLGLRRDTPSLRFEPRAPSPGRTGGHDGSGSSRPGGS